MKTSVLSNKDYYGGALVLLTGLATTVVGLRYHTGTLDHMGPGFFPVVVGVLLAIVGLLIAVTARAPATPDAAEHGHSHGLPDFRGCACIIIGTLAFILLGEYGGLIPATFAIVLISALGDRNNTLKQALMLAVVMCVVAVVVFWWALQLQLPLFSWGG